MKQRRSGSYPLCPLLMLTPQIPSGSLLLLVNRFGRVSAVLRAQIEPASSESTSLPLGRLKLNYALLSTVAADRLTSGDNQRMEEAPSWEVQGVQVKCQAFEDAVVSEGSGLKGFRGLRTFSGPPKIPEACCIPT